MHVTIQAKVRAPATARGFQLPPEFTARFEYPEDHAVELAIAVESGDAVCNEVRIVRREGGPSLTGVELRRLPLTTLVKYACSIATGGRASDDAAVVPASQSVRDAVEDAVANPRRRDRITDERLREVARVVRENAEPGVAPWHIVKDFLHVGRTQAFRLLQLAHERGFLAERETKVKR